MLKFFQNFVGPAILLVRLAEEEGNRVDGPAEFLVIFAPCHCKKVIRKYLLVKYYVEGFLTKGRTRGEAVCTFLCLLDKKFYIYSERVLWGQVGRPAGVHDRG